MPVAEAVSAFQTSANDMMMTWSQLAEYLEASPLEQLSLPLLAAKYGFTYNKELGLFFKTAKLPIGHPESVLGSGAKATFDSYVTAGGNIARFGASAVKNAVSNVALAVKGGAKAAMGVLSIPLPTAAAALAPFAGVALGVGLYNSNPEFWTRISQTLLPFCWKDSQYVKAFTDETGKIYLPKSAIDALRNTISNEKYGGSYYTTANFIFASGAKGESVPCNEGLYYWQENGQCRIRRQDIPYDSAYYNYRTRVYWYVTVNVDGTYKSATYLRSGMRFSNGKTLRIILIPDEMRTYGQGIIIYFGNSLLSDEELTWRILLNQPEFDEYENVRMLWCPTGFIPAINFYFVNIEGNIYLGTTIGRGLWENIWPPNENWVLGTYLIGDPIATASELGDYAPHTQELEIPQVDTVATPSTVVQVVTGMKEDGTEETEDYVPVEFPTEFPTLEPDTAMTPTPNPSEDPSSFMFPNEETWPEDYPYPIPENPLPNPLGTPQTVTVAEPEEDPSTEEEPESGGDMETEVPTPVQAPPDEGETPEPDPEVILIPPVYNTNAGLIKVYNPSATEIQDFGAWMWQTWSGNVADTLQKIFLNHPLDGVIGLHELYATPHTNDRGNIKCGFLDSGVEANIVDRRYTSINCGSVIVPEYYGNYLDYAPHTEVSCYLPFVGIVNLNADDLIGRAVNITYKVDSYTGCVAAQITTAKSGFSALLYQYEGNAAVTIPLSSGNQTALITSALSIGAGAIGGMITGGIAGAATGLASRGLHAIGSSKASVAHSGTFGGTYGAMGLKKPYLIIRRPVQKEIVYQDIYGFPAHNRVKLSSCSGFVRVVDCEFSSSTATETEKQMILDGLKSGVYV